MRTRSLVTLFLVEAVIVSATGFALASPVDRSFQTGGWTLDCILSSSEAEPGSILTLDFTISALGTNYDFILSVQVGEPLRLSEGTISYSELHIGDVREKSLQITVPKETPAGGTYVINLRASSHSNPHDPITGLRLPFDNPEYSLDTVQNPEHALRLTIVLRPHLTFTDPIVPFLSPLERTDFTVGIRVRNVGTGQAENVSAEVSLPEGITLVDGTGTYVIGNIPAGEEREVTWRVKAEASGVLSVEASVRGDGFKDISTTIDVAVFPIWPIVAAIVVIIAIVIIVIRLRQE